MFFTGRKFDACITTKSPSAANRLRPLSPRNGRNRSASTKLWMTAIGLSYAKLSIVCCRNHSDTAVTPSDCSIEKRVIS